MQLHSQSVSQDPRQRLNVFGLGNSETYQMLQQTDNEYVLREAPELETVLKNWVVNERERQLKETQDWS
jgi:hypothetical protein